MKRKSKKEPTPTQANFNEIYEAYKTKSLNLCRRICKDSAEDAHQNAWLKIYSKLPEFRGESALSSWIFRITLNSCLMHIRKEKTLLTRVTYLSEAFIGDAGDDAGDVPKMDPMDRLPSNDIPLERTLIGQQKINKVFSLLRKRFSDHYQTVLSLMWEDGLTAYETAKALKTTVPSVKCTVNRARVFLRENEHFMRAY